MQPQKKQQHDELFYPEFVTKRVEHYYSERVEKTWGGGHILRGRTPDKNSIVLMSNDYLSLANHPDVIQAQAESLLQQGNGMMMSGVFLDNSSPQKQFEEEMASFMQAESAIVSQSGWCANIGLIQSLADKTTPVYIDMFAHMSLWEGIQSAGATARAFRHNDPISLEKMICQHGAGVILVDSIYSTSGRICPLAEIADIAHRYGCIFIVDESHSLGTHGDNGEGLVAALGLTDQVHFRTASLAKAFCGRAGIITCPSWFSDYFMQEARPAIFSSTLLPHEVASLSASLNVIRSEQWRRDRLQENADYLRTQLDQLGYNVSASQSQIISLESGDEKQTMILRDALESRGLFGAVFMAPATPKKRSIIRFSVQASMSKQDMQHMINVCRDVREEVGMTNWSSTRRKNRPLHIAKGI